MLIGCYGLATTAETQIKLEDIEKDNLKSEKNTEILKTEQTQGLTQSDETEEKGESKEPSHTDIRYAPLPSGYEGSDISYVTPSAPYDSQYDEPKSSKCW